MSQGLAVSSGTTADGHEFLEPHPRAPGLSPRYTGLRWRALLRARRLTPSAGRRLTPPREWANSRTLGREARRRRPEQPVSPAPRGRGASTVSQRVALPGLLDRPLSAAGYH